MHRRSFLRFVAGSPLLAACPAFAQTIISKPEESLSVFDFEAAAQKTLPPAHWGYLATGVDDDATLRANREGFVRYQLRPRRLVDVSRVDMKTELLGQQLEAPIIISPVGAQKMYHADAEIATARAARSRNSLMVLSTATNVPLEEVAKTRGGSIWFQLYLRQQWQDTLALVKRAEAAGCPVMVFTVDVIPGRNFETMQRFARRDTRNCSKCHEKDPGADPVGHSTPAAVDWDMVQRLKDLTRMKLVVKGIETREDAQLCLQKGVDGIIVSNHGGRAAETGRASIDCLPEVISAVGGKIPVIVDGGFRRGTDVFKALALGARAIGIGRPYIWGLSAFGQPGIEQVLDILRNELLLTMRQCGTRSITEITSAYVTRP